MTFSFFQKQMFQDRSGRMIQAFSPSCSPSSSPPREFSPSRSPSPPSRWAMPRTSPPSSPKGASASISSMSEGDEDEKWGINITHIIDCTLPTNSHTLAAMTGQLPSWDNLKYCTQHRVVEVLFSYAGITANIWKPSQPWTDPERGGGFTESIAATVSVFAHTICCFSTQINKKKNINRSEQYRNYNGYWPIYLSVHACTIVWFSVFLHLEYFCHHL